MRIFWVTLLLVAAGFSAGASVWQSGKPSSEGKNAELEKTLWDVEQQWLCTGPYRKASAKECVDFRSKYWVDQVFEISQTGKVQTKADMVATQSANAAAHPNPVPGTGPNRQEFQLMAVYGNIALATDHTIFKAADDRGHLAVTSETRVLRVFVKENGDWRPAGAALVRIAEP